MTPRLADILNRARRLRDRGPGSMYPEDEAGHLASATLELLIEALEEMNADGEQARKE